MNTHTTPVLINFLITWIRDNWDAERQLRLDAKLKGIEPGEYNAVALSEIDNALHQSHIEFVAYLGLCGWKVYPTNREGEICGIHNYFMENRFDGADGIYIKFAPIPKKDHRVSTG